ncbi:hypothetical protein Mapa_014320 [Marchantia paleacea]|nr:hypothetical protein Mapa_014320 [Marchantia paleacea]
MHQRRQSKRSSSLTDPETGTGRHNCGTVEEERPALLQERTNGPDGGYTPYLTFLSFRLVRNIPTAYC